MREVAREKNKCDMTQRRTVSKGGNIRGLF